jgi:hypothetical protein
MRELTNYNESFDVKRPWNFLGVLDRISDGRDTVESKSENERS